MHMTEPTIKSIMPTNTNSVIETKKMVGLGISNPSASVTIDMNKSTAITNNFLYSLANETRKTEAAYEISKQKAEAAVWIVKLDD